MAVLRSLTSDAGIGLALALLAGAGLAIHSFWNLTLVDLGLKTDHVLTFYLPLPDSRSNDPAKLSACYHEILGRIASVPGVQARGSHDRNAHVGRWLWHAVHHPGRANECGSVAAANRWIWHGDARLFLDVRDSRRQRSSVFRAGQGDERQGSDGQRGVC
jgi:hypothetical protein